MKEIKQGNAARAGDLEAIKSVSPSTYKLVISQAAKMTDEDLAIARARLKAWERKVLED